MRKRQEAEADSSVANLLVKQAEELRKQNEREKKENAKKTSNAHLAKFVGAFMAEAASQEAEVYAHQDEPEFEAAPVLVRRPSLKRQSSVEAAPVLVRQSSGSKRKAAAIEQDEEREEELSDLEEPENGMNARMAMFLESSQDLGF